MRDLTALNNLLSIQNFRGIVNPFVPNFGITLPRQNSRLALTANKMSLCRINGWRALKE